MRKNRRKSARMTVAATNTFRFGVVIMFLFVMVIVNLLASASNTQLLKTIGDKRRELQSLENTYQRELSRWEGMCTPEKIESALLANGMSMSLPKYDQCVRMKRGGKPVAGQLSVAKARQQAGGRSAKYRRKSR